MSEFEETIIIGAIVYAAMYFTLGTIFVLSGVYTFEHVIMMSSLSWALSITVLIILLIIDER